MKRLVLISEANKKGNQQANDLVGIFEMDHQFSPKELEIFTFIEVEDHIVEVFEAALSAIHQAAPDFMPTRKYYEDNEIKFN